MSVYVTSDLHGYPLDRIREKLDEIGFGTGDKLYILGDCIDRGPDGLKILRWVMAEPNITLILGNHEAMMLNNSFLFEGEGVISGYDLVGDRKNSYDIWMANGGLRTLDAAGQYTEAQMRYIIRFLDRAPLYKEIEVAGKKYVLVHSGMGGFAPDKPLSEYSRFDLVWSRPSLGTRYYEDGRTVIFGHTPTFVFGSQYEGKPVFTDTWIDIDVGAGKGKDPLILRLDDMQTFYAGDSYEQ